MLFYLPLLGNPHKDEALAAKYRAAFGDACYKSDVPTPTFNCFYKKADVAGTATKEGKACADAKMIATIFGASPYADQYKCEPSGSDYSLQVGPDVSNVIYIKYGEAPLETSLIDVNGVPTAINGPYRNLPEPPNVKVGGSFHCASGQGPNITQWDFIIATNRKAHGGVIHSDFAGFTWPCDEPGKPICTEETELIKGSSDLAKAVQVHHEVRATDRRRCDWGTNSNSNAVVISWKLNRYFWYRYPSANEVNWVNNIPPYTP